MITGQMGRVGMKARPGDPGRQQQTPRNFASQRSNLPLYGEHASQGRQILLLDTALPAARCIYNYTAGWSAILWTHSRRGAGMQQGGSAAWAASSRTAWGDYDNNRGSGRRLQRLVQRTVLSRPAQRSLTGTPGWAVSNSRLHAAPTVLLTGTVTRPAVAIRFLA